MFYACVEHSSTRRAMCDFRLAPPQRNSRRQPRSSTSVCAPWNRPAGQQPSWIWHLAQMDYPRSCS